jgi:hypothetical protein
VVYSILISSWSCKVVYSSNLIIIVFSSFFHFHATHTRAFLFVLFVGRYGEHDAVSVMHLLELDCFQLFVNGAVTWCFSDAYFVQTIFNDFFNCLEFCSTYVQTICQWFVKLLSTIYVVYSSYIFDDLELCNTYVKILFWVQYMLFVAHILSII